MARAPSVKSLRLLQPIIWPQAGVPALFAHRQGAVAMTPQDITLFPGAEVDFKTWFNLFNLATWQRNCALESLSLRIEGEGVLLVTLRLDVARGLEQSRDVVLHLSPGKPQAIALNDMLVEGGATGALLSFSLAAPESSARLIKAAWVTADAPRRTPDLTLAVTTFRREAEVARTVARFEAFRRQSPLKRHLRMIVTDNGQSLDMVPPEGVHIVPNANLGGAGGFTRGYLEARDRGASHVVFMDDDASIHMESLERTWALLAYATDPATAIAGAMSTDTNPHEFWEYGALFFTECRPQYIGWDMRGQGSSEAWRRNDLRWIEHHVSDPAPQTLYGGWWYFAFPVAAVRHLAFPFFVRGDDVSFSLAHDFNIVRLNGVVSYQESFTDKESPQNWYLDLRSHMAHHLSLEALEIGRAGVLKIALKFFLKNLVRMHYDTLAALNLAVEDVTQGPDFFDTHADMATRRADLKALTQTEVWRPQEDTAALPNVRVMPPSRMARWAMKFTLNGLLLPFYSRLGAAITLEAGARGSLGHAWGAARMVILSADGRRSYEVRHSKKRALREGLRFLRAAWQFWQAYPDLLRSYQGAYGRLTSETYWRKKLGL